MPAGSYQGSEVGELRKYRVDNGSAYVSKWLLRVCASLGVRLVHSKSG
jgi:transposase InsO family protein